MSNPMRCIPALALLLAPAAAQGVAYEWTFAPLGDTVASAGDVDADGRADFAIGHVGYDATSINAVEVRSGADGTSLWSVPTKYPGASFGLGMVSLGDLDGDGREDLVASGPLKSFFGQGIPYVRAMSGVDGSTLWEVSTPDDKVSFGSSLARLSDLDGDGVDDLLVGASNQVPAATRVLSGASGALLFTVPAPAGASVTFGYAVARLGDLDGDTVEDFGVGDVSFAAGSGRISLHSGVDGSALGFVTPPAQAPAPWGDFGRYFAGLDDVDVDGVPEIAVGAPLLIDGPHQEAGGMVWVYSGATGSVLREIAPEPNPLLENFGFAVDRTDDLDGDGLAELRFGAGIYQDLDPFVARDAELRTYSPATGELLQSWPGMSSFWFEDVPDVDGDGRTDVLISFVGKGKVLLVLDGQQPPLPQPGCPAQPSSNGCAPLFTTQGTPSLTQFDDLEVYVSKLPVGAVGVCVYGPNAAATPFGGGLLCVGPPSVRTPLQATSAFPVPCGGGPSATLACTLTKPELTALGLPAGDGFHLQAWFRDPGLAPPMDFGLSGSLFVELWP